MGTKADKTPLCRLLSKRGLASRKRGAELARAGRVKVNGQVLRKMGVRGGSPAQALAVVALGLAEDLEVAERRREELEERLDDTLQEAVAKIDRALAEEARHAETA